MQIPEKTSFGIRTRNRPAAGDHRLQTAGLQGRVSSMSRRGELPSVGRSRKKCWGHVQDSTNALQ